MAGSEAFLTRAYNKVMWGASVDWPGDANFRLYGLDLWNCPWRRSEGRVCYDRQGLVSRVPACPGMPPRPPAAWATWAPAWLELPLPEKIPRDFWYVPEQADRDLPQMWFCPLWHPASRPRVDDPEAVCMLWDVATLRPGLPCVHQVACPWRELKVGPCTSRLRPLLPLPSRLAFF